LLSLLAPRPTSSALFPYTTLFRNIRDRHMVEALSRIKAFHGPHAKAIVWEHNTHIGDARATDMAADGMVNVGQLVREKFGQEQVYAVGFGTYQGTVIAADKWGGD